MLVEKQIRAPEDGSIEMSPGVTPRHARIGGETLVQTVAGEASFTDLHLDIAGEYDGIEATTTYFDHAFTEMFTVDPSIIEGIRILQDFPEVLEAGSIKFSIEGSIQCSIECLMQATRSTLRWKWRRSISLDNR